MLGFCLRSHPMYLLHTYLHAALYVDTHICDGLRMLCMCMYVQLCMYTQLNTCLRYSYVCAYVCADIYRKYIHILICTEGGSCIRKNNFLEGAVLHWHRLCREVVGSACQSVFKKRVSMALRDVVSGHVRIGRQWDLVISDSLILYEKEATLLYMYVCCVCV